jgi:hypothetical protein
MTKAKPKPIDKIHDLLATQGSPGNWDYDSYMLGLFNGLELARSVIEGDNEPQFRGKPAEGWRRDRGSEGYGGAETTGDPTPAMEEAWTVLD